jgi:hypothetical protein
MIPIRPTLLAALCQIFLAVCAGRSLAADSSDAGRSWTNYHAIMWIGDSAYRRPEKIPLFFERLKQMGINTGMVHGDGSLSPLVENQFPYYVENVVNKGLCLKFRSKVIDWDKFVTDWARNGRPDSALVRDYALDDPEWLDWARKEMRTLVRKNKGNHPLAYDIRDELSVTMSANPFDYDFNPITLGNFRAWLRQAYGSLDALNAQWETKFAYWEAVMPFTTDQIKNRMASGDAIPRGKPDWQAVQGIKFDPAAARKTPTRWNFSPWADFRSFMDMTLASALAEIRKAGKAEDPSALFGIEGTQMPAAFGGYDLARLSKVLDWVEPYDIGNARDIFGSFMRGKPIITTVFENNKDRASRRLWHLLLEGDRGCIIWWSEDCIDWNTEDYQLTAKAKALAPVLEEMTSPLAQLFMKAQKQTDPVYILYSQPSVQVDWLLESTVDGSTWLRRFSSFESDHNRMVKVRNSWVKLFQDAGFTPQFIDREDLASGKLSAGPGVLVLPQAYALSEAEAEQVKKFSEGTGKTVLADGSPGLFDEHGKLRAASALDSIFPPALSQDTVYLLAGGKPAKTISMDISKYALDRLKTEPAHSKQLVSEAGLKPFCAYSIAGKSRLHRYKAGDAQLLAFERNISYQMSEDLKQGGGNEPLETSLNESVQLSQSFHIYDLRTGKYLGRADRLQFTLDPWKPSLFALVEKPLPDGTDPVKFFLMAKEQ